MLIELPVEYEKLVEIVDCDELKSGIVNVKVRLAKPLGPRERGKLLMDLEDMLCKANENVRIWNEPLGDKNSLRNLRGVKL